MGKFQLSDSFDPLIGQQLQTLILGTMPGRKSLHDQQYYAHPRNALWPILCAIVQGGDPDFAVHTRLNYEQRCALVTQAGFGLWDVLASCEREGSLDSNIVRTTEIPNNIEDLVNKHPELQMIACNGRTAETLFKRHIQTTMIHTGISLVCLPSSSPAMARLDLKEKYRQWCKSLITDKTRSAG